MEKMNFRTDIVWDTLLIYSDKNYEDIVKKVIEIIEDYLVDNKISYILNPYDIQEKIYKFKTDEKITEDLDYCHHIKTKKINHIYYSIEYNIYNKNNILVFSKQYNIIKKKEGNCFDKFIIKAINPKLYVINQYKTDILRRQKDRNETNEYHSTSCYENDFSQLMKIKKEAEKLVNLCNKELEALSEKYTKL